MDQQLSPSPKTQPPNKTCSYPVDQPQAPDLWAQVELLRQLATEPLEPSVDAYRERFAAISERLSDLAALLAGPERNFVDTIATNVAAAASNAADIAHQTPVVSDKESAPTSSSTRGRKPRLAVSQTKITSQVVVEALRSGRLPADLEKPCDHTFGQDNDDHIRLVTAAALGVPETTLCGRWSPPLRPHQPFHLFTKLTGNSIKPFREEVRKELIADFKSMLTEKIMEIALDEANGRSPKPQSAHHAEVSESLVRVALKSCSTDDLRTVSAAFGINSRALEDFTFLVLYRAKTAMFELLERSPLAIMLGNNKVQMVRDYVLGDAPLREVGAQIGITRERVRQFVEEVASSTPLVRAIIESSDPTQRRAKTRGANPQGIPTELLVSLVQEVERDPVAAHARAISMDSNPRRLANENAESYHKRIFLAAFVGSYIDERRSRQYPPPLRGLEKGADDFFRKLALACADKKIGESIESFRSEITLEQIASKLSDKDSPLPPRDAPLVLRFVEGLIRQPSKSRELLWREINTESSVGPVKRVFSLVEPMVRDAAQKRAEQACLVLRQPWVTVWLREERLLKAIDARIVRQQSIVASARELGIRIGSFAGLWAELLGVLPSLCQLVPRMIRASNEPTEQS